MILHMETTFRDSNRNTKTLRREQEAIADGAVLQLEAGKSTGGGDDTSIAIDTPAPKAAAKAKAKAKAKAEAKGTASAVEKEADEKKQASAAIQWAEKLRKDVARVMHESSELLGVIMKEDEWKWARTDASLEKLRGARASLDQLKISSTFWKEWNYQGYWSRWVRANMEEVAIIRAVNSAKNGWENAVDTVDEEVARLKRKQTADLAPVKASKGGRR